MSVYVDPLHGHITDEAPSCFVKAGKACHLYADTLEELHAFALKLGLKRAWFQANRTMAHYDLVPSKRIIAVHLGAIEHSSREAVNKWKELRQK